MNFNKKTYMAIGFCILITLIYLLNQKIPLTKNNLNIDGDFIVQISSAVGEFNYKIDSSSKVKTSTNFPENLYNNSELTTSTGSRVQLSFENGWVIDLNENSMVSFQTWSVDDQSKYLIHILSGSYELISKGDEDGLLVLFKNNFYSPGAELIEKRSINMEIISTNITQPQDSSKPLPEVSNEVTKKSLSKNEISSRYIEASILKNRHLFEKCLANRIRENNVVNGRLLVGFNVTEQGRLKDINIIENKTQDKKIEPCIIDVFTRTKIRNYNGPKTFFAFPVDFK